MNFQVSVERVKDRDAETVRLILSADRQIQNLIEFRYMELTFEEGYEMLLESFGKSAYVYDNGMRVETGELSNAEVLQILWESK